MNVISNISDSSERYARCKAVLATSPNFYNMSRPVVLKPALVVE